MQWAEFLPKWLGLCVAAGRIARIDGTVMTLSELSAQESVDSDPLDLGHLSLRGKQA